MTVAIEWSTKGPSATAEKYKELLALLGAVPDGPHPGVGCLFHWVRVDNDGLHGVDVWDTQAHFDDFAENQLGPAAAKVGMALTHSKSHDVLNFLTAH